MQQDNTTLGTEKISTLLYKLAIPAVTAQLVNMLYNMVDRIYIGHMPGVGQVALTGMGVCLPLIMLVSAFAALVSMGGAPRASIAMGRGDNREAEKIMGNCMTLLLAVSVVLTAVLRIFPTELLTAFGASENTLPYALEYIEVYSVGTVFVLMTLGLNAFITAQGFATTGMLTVLIGAVLNIALDPLCIFTFGMGVRGAALATILSQGVSCVWVLLFLSRGKSHLKLRAANFKPSLKTVGPCVALGLSPFIMQATESVITICFNTSLGKYGGDIAIGAMTILSSVMQFSLLPLIGLTQGAQPIISYNYGARDAGRVKEAFRLLLKYCVIYSAGLWVIVMAVPQVFARLFTTDQALIDYAKWSMRVYMSGAFLLGLQLACQQTFIALGNAKASLFLAILRKILLLIPLIYILPQFIGNQVLAVYLAEPIADVIAVTVTAILFYTQFKHAMQELGGPRSL